MTDSKRQKLETIKQTRAALSMDNMKWLVQELELAWRENEAITHAANEIIKKLDGPNNELKQALEREVKLVEALGDSCLCGEFEYIATKCPACQALEAHKKAKG